MPLGAFRLNSLARYVAAAAGGASWADWSDSNMDTLNANAADSGYTAGRGYEPLSFISDDKFFCLYSNPGTPFYYDGYHTYSRSGNTISFDGRTETTSTITMNFTNVQNTVLDSFNKFIIWTGGPYTVGTYTSSGISMPTTYTSDTTGAITYITAVSDTQYHPHPTDQTKIMASDLDGDIMLLTFNNSTDAIVKTTDTTIQANKVSNASNGVGFWTETSGTYKYAFLYWDSSATSWKIRHYAADLASYTDHTLNNTPNLPTNIRAFLNYRQPVNKCLMFMRDSTNNNMPSFVVSWNGSSFTQHSTTTITTSDSTYVDPNWDAGVYYLDDNVWACHTLMNDEGGDAYSRQVFFIIKADESNTVSKLGEVPLNAGNSGGGNAKGGVSLSPSKDYAVIWGESTVDGITARLIYRS